MGKYCSNSKSIGTAAMLDQKPAGKTYSVLKNRRTSKIPSKFQVISQYLGTPGFTGIKSGILE